MEKYQIFVCFLLAIIGGLIFLLWREKKSPNIQKSIEIPEMSKILNQGKAKTSQCDEHQILSTSENIVIPTTSASSQSEFISNASKPKKKKVHSNSKNQRRNDDLQGTHFEPQLTHPLQSPLPGNLIADSDQQTISEHALSYPTPVKTLQSPEIQNIFQSNSNLSAPTPESVKRISVTRVSTPLKLTLRNREESEIKEENPEPQKDQTISSNPKLSIVEHLPTASKPDLPVQNPPVNGKTKQKTLEQQIISGVIIELNEIRIRNSLGPLRPFVELQNDLNTYLHQPNIRSKPKVLSEPIKTEFNPRIAHYWCRIYHGTPGNSIKDSVKLFDSHPESMRHLLSTVNSVAVGVDCNSQTRVVIIIGENGLRPQMNNISFSIGRASQLLKELNKKRKESKLPKLVFNSRLQKPVQIAGKTFQAKDDLDQIKAYVDQEMQDQGEGVGIFLKIPKTTPTNFHDIADECIKAEEKLLDPNFTSIGISFEDSKTSQLVFVSIILAILTEK